MYVFMMLIGIVAVLLMLLLAMQEKKSRQKYYSGRLNAMLSFVRSGKERWNHELHRVYYTIGRDRLKCDLAPEPLRTDVYVSRKHAVFWFDGTQYHIAPVCKWHVTKGFITTTVKVNGKTVPLEGTVVNYEDEIGICGHVFYLLHSQ